MCLATAYLVGGGGKPILEEVSYMQLDGDQVELVRFAGEKKGIPGRLLDVAFVAETRLLEQNNASTE